MTKYSYTFNVKSSILGDSDKLISDDVISKAPPEFIVSVSKPLNAKGYECNLQDFTDWIDDFHNWKKDEAHLGYYTMYTIPNKVDPKKPLGTITLQRVIVK
jgi:hypothetical protein